MEEKMEFSGKMLKLYFHVTPVIINLGALLRKNGNMFYIIHLACFMVDYKAIVVAKYRIWNFPVFCNW
jgi:protein associated with RNAse G/E